MLVAGAAAALTLGLSLAASHGLGWLALALAAVPPVLVWWRIPASRSVRDLAAAPGMVGPHLAVATSATMTGLVIFLAPFYLQRVLGVSAGASGLALLALPLATGALGPVGGMLADPAGPRRIAVTGLAVAAVGLVLVAPLGYAWGPAGLAWRLAVVGAGTGLFLGPNMTVLMSTAPSHLLATTGASANLVRQLGFALGPALATITWAASGYTPSGMRVAVGLAAGLTALGLAALARSHPAPSEAGDLPSGAPRQRSTCSTE